MFPSCPPSLLRTLCDDRLYDLDIFSLSFEIVSEEKLEPDDDDLWGFRMF